MPAPVSVNQSAGTKLPGPIAILKQAWRIYVNRFWVLLGIFLVPAVLIFACVALVEGGAALAAVFGLKLTAITSVAMLIALAILAFLFYMAVIYVSIWSQAATLFAVKGAEQRVGFRESFRQASHKIGSLFGASVLILGIVGGALLLLTLVLVVLFVLGNMFLSSAAIYIDFILGVLGGIAVVVTVWVLAIRYSLATYIVIGDDVTAMSAVKRSRDYVKGYWWPMFWRVLFLACLVVVCALVSFLLVVLLGLALKGFGSGVAAIISSLVNVALSVIVAPLYAVYGYQVYVNLRAIKGESQVPGDKKASGWIFVAVIVALLVLLAVPVSLLALNSARVKSRDAKRVIDAEEVRTGLELYFNDKGSYPTDLSQLTPTYIEVVPTAPVPADGSCTDAENQYTYTLVDPTDYYFTFCTGDVSGSYVAGMHTMTQQGIDTGATSDNGNWTPENSQPSDSTSAQMNTYSTSNFYFQYPASWIVSYTGDPTVSPTSCGDAWGDAAACVNLNPASLGTHPADIPVEVLSFKTTTSPLTWCQSRTDTMANCSVVDSSGSSTVTASAPAGDSPEVEWAVLGGQSTIEVFELSDVTYQSEFEEIVNSALPQ